MWPSTRLTELPRLQHPIIQAPMLGSLTPELAAAVSGAGGLGSLGFGWGTIEVAETGLAALRSLTTAPFNLNFFVTGDAPPQSADDRARMGVRLAPFYEELGAGEVPDPPSSPQRPGFDIAILDLIARERPSVVVPRQHTGMALVL